MQNDNITIFNKVLNNLNNKENLLKFFEFQGKMSSYSLRNTILLYNSNPKATLCATMQQWESIGKRVFKNADGMTVYLNNTKTKVFDINQTFGKGEIKTYGKIDASEEIENELMKRYQSVSGNLLVDISNVHSKPFLELIKIKDNRLSDLSNQVAAYCISLRFDNKFKIPDQSIKELTSNRLILETVLGIANNSVKLISREINNIIKGVDKNEERRIYDNGILPREVSGGNNSRLSQIEPMGKTSLQVHGRMPGIENGRIDTYGGTGKSSIGTTRDSVQQVLDIYGGIEEKESSTKGIEHVRNNTVQLSNRRTSERIGEVRTTHLTSDKDIIFDKEKMIKMKQGIKEYIKQKEKDGNKIIGVQVGEVLLFFGEDADRVAPVINQRTIKKSVVILGDINVTGSLFNNLEEVTQKLIQEGMSFCLFGERKGQYYLAKDNNMIEENYHINKEFKYETLAKKKYENNISAIKVLRFLEKENRKATKEEKEKLVQYVGWGGLPQVFNEDAWTQEYYELKNLLNKEEYSQAKGSVLNSFYTQPVIIQSMYTALKRMGVRGGYLLDPAVGTGNFIGMIPNDVNFKVTGIELDSITGKIAQELYPKEIIHINGFEKEKLQDNSFDVVIGNVPFGNYKLYEPRYTDNDFLIHDHFFAKAIDKVKPNGIIAFITSKGTLDKKDSKVRRYLCERSELLGAIRLPNTAFKNVNTGVTSDIIFLKKREDIEKGKIEDWVEVDNNADNITINKYFVKNPYMMCGNMVETTNAFGLDYTLKADTRTLEEALNEAVSYLPKEIFKQELKQELKQNQILQATKELDIDDYKIGEFLTYKNSIFQRNEKGFALLNNLSQNGTNIIKEMIKVKIVLQKCLNRQLEGCSDQELKEIQKELNSVYDIATEEIGPLSARKNKRAFLDDPSYILLASLEDIDEDTKQVKKAKIFKERTIKFISEITHVDTASEALTVALNNKGYVDILYMSQLTGVEPEVVINELHGIIFKNPNSHNIKYEGYETSDQYLSGNVREKLREAEKALQEDIRYTINVERLKSVQPKELLAGDIDVRLGATWIPKEDIKKFANEVLGSPVNANIDISYISVISEWKIEGFKGFGNIVATKTYGTNRINAYDLLEQALNLKTPTVYDVIEDDKRVVNQKETMAARDKQDKIKNKFKQWIFQEPERRERLVRKYNEVYNSSVVRTYDGSHLVFKGLAQNIKLLEHQKNGVAHILYADTGTLLAHCVGAGKTWTMVAGAMELKRLGLANKVLMVVPNHLTEQWGKEWLEAYPSANLLVASKKDFAKENRKRFASKIATGNYDAIIIGHSSFGKIDVTNETKERHIKKEIVAVEEAILKILEGDSRKDTDTRIIKRLETTKKNLEANLEEQLDIEKDDTVYFEHLGIDKIFIDEAHEFKNLYVHTKMNNVAGVPQTKAKKAADLFMKINYLNEISKNKSNVVFATGTPISNSMAEMFTMQRYLQGEMLNSKGLGHFDAWASNFGEAVASFEVTPDGSGFRSKTRFSKFVNLPELMSLYRASADIQTADMLNLPTPTLKNGKPTIVKLRACDELKEIMQEDLMIRSQKIKDGLVDPHDDNMLKVTNDGRKVALDIRLYDEAYGEYEDCKILSATENIYEIWNKTKKHKSTQLVFCDLSTPNKDKFNVYDELKRKLIEKGINEYEIRYIHEAKTDDQKNTLFKKVRSGEVRVLMGSTAKMGAGTNVQDKLVALHHIDVPWRPSDIEQREGRILRQGNENKEVEIFRYVTEGSFDSYSWQTIETKQKFISQVMSGDTTIRSIDDLDESTLNYAEIKAIATGNPLILKKMEVDTEIARLRVLESQYVNQKYQMQDSINKSLPRDISKFESILEKLKIDLDHIKFKQDKGFSISINNIKFEKRVEAGNYIMEQCFVKMQPNSKIEDVGEFVGYKFDIQKDYMKEGTIIIKGALNYKTDITTNLGTITRMENKISIIPEKVNQTISKIEDCKYQLKVARSEIENPFEHKERLEELLKEQKEINMKLEVTTKKEEREQTKMVRNKNVER